MKQKATGSIVCVVMAAIGVLGLIVFPGCSAEITYPFERAKTVLDRTVIARVAGLFRGAEAEAENARLRREVAALSLVRGELARVEAENARLRRALNYGARHREDTVAAGVLSSGGGAASAHRSLRVDKGTLDGVKEGCVVVVPEGLVGRVAKVSPHTADVRLITDESLKVSCVAEANGQQRPCGILCGGDADSLALRHFTGSADVPPRSRIFTSGLGGVFPKGIAVGTLLDVRKDAGGLASEGEVQPAVDFSALEDVFIRCAK